MSIVYLQSYAPPPVNRKEILRYAGVRGEVPELEALLRECIEEVAEQLTYRVCYCECSIQRHAHSLDLGFIETRSRGLQTNLEGCESILLFAATVGMAIDRLIARYATLSPTKSLLFQAIGAERIEALCDCFQADMAQKYAALGYVTRPRFSPGYGDFPLEAQRSIFAVLDCPRKIGLTLNDSLLMSPSKSVTALIGLLPSRDKNTQ